MERVTDAKVAVWGSEGVPAVCEIHGGAVPLGFVYNIFHSGPEILWVGESVRVCILKCFPLLPSQLSRGSLSEGAGVLKVFFMVLVIDWQDF